MAKAISDSEPPDSSADGGQRRDRPHAPTSPSFRRDTLLALGALGVVYGDIGTSPLYAMKLSAMAAGGTHPAPYAVLGALSLVFWALAIVVTLKYVFLILRADNNGEGGVLALATLAHRSAGLSRRAKTFIGIVALVGLALFYGDGMLTPAISVLSAMEGLSSGSSDFSAAVVPLTLIILIGLFLLQSRGTDKIGKLFGPVILVWFSVLTVLGAMAIARAPTVLNALNPYYGIALFVREPWTAFVALGSVVLAVTGCEALYADMGHFGRKAIRLAWLLIAFPALSVNYFGQGALMLNDPSAASDAFYRLAPDWAHYPMIILATMATIIASQAVISGAFSITSQAVQLGQLPRMEIRHTSATEYGQIYVPRINALLCFGVVLIVLVFKSSDALGTAYGIAVTGVMLISTFLVSVVAIRQWRWRVPIVLGAFGLFALVDIAFLASNSLKIVEGGWLPLAAAAGVFMVMDTWRVGRRLHLEKLRESSMAVDTFLERADKTPQRVTGTALFMGPRVDVVPGALLHSLKHYKVLHERIVFATVVVEDMPYVNEDKRLDVERLGKGFYEVKLHYGFFETPDVPVALEKARGLGLALDLDTTTFFLGRETLVPSTNPHISRWRVGLYTWLASNALAPARFYYLPPNRVVELGTQISI